MKREMATKGWVCVGMGVFLLLALASSSTFLGAVKKPEKMQFPPPSPAEFSCTTCAKLTLHICAIPGYGCCGCDVLDNLGALCFFDPDIWIENHGSLASTPGTATMKWYDLLAKAEKKVTYTLPAIPPGGSDYTTNAAVVYILAKASDGVKISFTYSDSTGTTYTKYRKITKCPDK